MEFHWVSTGFNCEILQVLLQEESPLNDGLEMSFVVWRTILLGFTGFYWVSLAFVGFLPSLTGFSGSLPSLIGFDWVFLGCTGFTGFTE